MKFHDLSNSPLPTWLPRLDSMKDSSTPDGSLPRALAILEILQKSIPTMPEPLKQSFPISSKAAALLYALMDYAPSTSAREKVAESIVRCAAADGSTQEDVHSKLLELAIDYCNHFIRPGVYAISLLLLL